MNLNESKLWKEIHQQDECVRECLKYNLPILKEIFAARGSSEHAAQVAKYVFEIYTDMFVNIAAPSITTCYQGHVNYQNALVVGISQSGGAQDVYQVMKKCVDDGGICVSITNEPKCLMSTIGHYQLNNHCGIETSITAAKSYITQ